MKARARMSKWTPQKERVFRAAIQWAKKFSDDLDYSASPFLWSEDHALLKAVAALSKKRRGEG